MARQSRAAGRDRRPAPQRASGPGRIAPLLLALFLGLLLFGIALDEPSRVLEQARSICLECIGIG